MAEVLVTGGAGFIGSHLVDRLVAGRHAVTVLDNLEPQVHVKKPDYLSPKAKYVTGDVLDRPLVERLLKEHETVYHMAAMVGVGQSMYQIERYVQANTMGTARLLDILVNVENTVEKLVVCGSMSSYGEGRYKCISCGLQEPDLRPEAQLKKHEWEVKCPSCAKAMAPVATDETKPMRSNSIYAISKKDQEEMCLAVGRAYGIPTVSLRFFNAYGPRQSLNNPYTGVAAIFSSRIKNDHPPVVFEDGLQTRDFVDVEDVARALEAAGTKSGGDYQALNVGSGKPLAIKSIAETLIRLYGREKKLKPEVKNAFRAGDIRHCYADTRRIEAALGWKAKVPFEEGMKRLVAWGEKAEAVDGFDRAHKELKERGLVEK